MLISFKDIYNCSHKTRIFERGYLHRFKYACFLSSLYYVDYQNVMFYAVKVHIKYEKRKNEAITLSIKDLKGLLVAA